MGWLRDRRFVVALGTGYVLALAALVVLPWGWELNRLTVRLYVLFRYEWPIAPDWVGPDHYGILLNVVLFVPVGILLLPLTGRPWWWAVAAAVVASSLIELGQWRWLDRMGSWSDVVANTVGALAGAVGVTLLARAGSPPAGRAGPRRRR